jgi:hypothetical protein
MAIPESQHPKAAHLQSTRPTGSGDLTQISKGHSSSGIAVAVRLQIFARENAPAFDA